MARTYRNKSTVPHGFEVRDDGRLYCNTCCPNKQAQRESWTFPWDPDRCRCHPRWDEMNFRSKWSRKEKKKYRKAHFRQYRAKVKNAMRQAAQWGYEEEDWENLPQYRRTSGWLTW